MNRAMDKLACFGGLLFGVLVITGFTLVSDSSFPDTSQPGPDQYAHILANPPGDQFWIGVGLEDLGMLLLLCFAIRLAVLTARSARTPWLPWAGAALASISIAIKIGSSAPAFEAILHVRDLGANTTVALIGINDAASVVTLGADAVWLAMAGAALLTAADMPRWLGWTALAASGGMGLAMLGVDAGQMAALLWFIAAGVALVRARTTLPPQWSPEVATLPSS
jgi:hypothetical protein